MRRLIKVRKMTFKEQLTRYREIVEGYLDVEVVAREGVPPKIVEAMRYSLLAPGKRIRPALVFAVCEACGGDEGTAIPFAAAIEMVHCYSLIHDDLPGMDNDSLRRGRPTNHIVYGEGMAILAGDALLTLAFEELVCAGVPSAQRAEAARVLSRCAGFGGMIGGQALDLLGEGKTLTADEVYQLNKKKTADLFIAAVSLGAVAAGVEPGAFVDFANCLGVAFQLKDDLLDAEGDEATLGKSASDKDNDKCTLLRVWGKDKTEAELVRLTRAAKEHLAACPGKDKEFLGQLLEYLVERKN